MSNPRRTILYVAQFITDECLRKRNNHRHFSPAAFNKCTGMASLISKSGYNIVILSPSPVNNRTGKLYKTFSELYKKWPVIHGTVWDIPGVHILTSVLSLCYWLLRHKSDYQEIFFYNFRPETALPAYFARFFLRKPIYLEYEDGYFTLAINPLLRAGIGILEKIGIRMISGAVVVTPELATRVRSKNVQLIPGVLDEELVCRFKALGPKKGGPRVFMYAGQLDEIRGIDLFLELAERVIESVKGEYEFWVSGKGPLHELVESKVSKYPERIRYFGFLPRGELLNLYEEVDVFVSLQKPNHQFAQASYPSKVYEYLSTGRQVLGHDFTQGKMLLEEVYQDMCRVIRDGNEAIAPSHGGPMEVQRLEIFEAKSSR